MQKSIKEKIRDQLIARYDLLFPKKKLEEEEFKKNIKYFIDEIIKKEKIGLSESQKKQIIDELFNELVGLGPLKPLLEDATITEIMINGPDRIYIEKNGKLQLSDIKFKDRAHLSYTIERLISGTGRRIDEMSPYVNFSLSDGSRVNIIIPPVSLVGPVLTIRKFSPDISRVDDLISRNTLNKKMADFLIASIKAKLNIVFSGATGVGKTTTLNVLSSYIPDKERIITIEDTAELRLKKEHIVRLESRPASIEGRGGISIRNLFINSLRMRPDRIILGEIRGQEALDLIQAISSGHHGSLAVIHASSPQDVLSRLEMMFFTSGINLPLWMVRRQITDALDLIVHMEHLVDGTRKITHISEIREVIGEAIKIEDLFYFEQESIDTSGKVTGRWLTSGTRPLFISKFKKHGIELSADIFKTS